MATCDLCARPNAALDYAPGHEGGAGPVRGALCLECTLLVRFVERRVPHVTKALAYLGATAAAPAQD